MNKAYRLLMMVFWPWWGLRPRKRVEPPEHFNCRCVLEE